MIGEKAFLKVTVGEVVCRVNTKKGLACNLPQFLRGDRFLPVILYMQLISVSLFALTQSSHEMCISLAHTRTAP